MRAPNWLLSGRQLTDGVPVAVWHMTGYAAEDEETVWTYRTTPIAATRPVRGVVDVAVVCDECAEPVPVRIVDLATARRWRVRGNVLGWSGLVLFIALGVPLAWGAAALGLFRTSGATAVLAVVAWIVGFFALLFAICTVEHRALDRADGVEILPPGRTGHTLGAAGRPGATVRSHHTTTW